MICSSVCIISMTHAYKHLHLLSLHYSQCHIHVHVICINCSLLPKQLSCGFVTLLFLPMLCVLQIS